MFVTWVQIRRLNQQRFLKICGKFEYTKKCTNSTIACFLKCLIVSSAELKIRTHIIPVSLQQNIYMWISEVHHKEKGPAFIVVLSSGIVFSTILTQSVPMVCLKKQTQALFLNSKGDFLHEVCSTILQDKMLYLIISFECGTWLNCYPELLVGGPYLIWAQLVSCE